MKKEKIILYDAHETVFTHNGIRVLHPLECYINRNLTEYGYDLDMIYPIDETEYWKDIIEDRIIKANGQLFRIVHIDKSIIDNTLTVYAKHIFFDLQKNFIEDTNVVSKNGNMALAQLLGATSFTHNFVSYSDISKQNNFRCVRKNVLDALLGDDDATFINRWGGEFDVDNFNIKFLNQVGSDKGYKIKYGKNLTGLSLKTDFTEIVTCIRPIGFDGIELNDGEKYVYSANVNNYSMPIIKEIKYEHVKYTGSPNYDADNNEETDVIYNDLADAQAELRRLASLEFTENEIDLPKVTCEINFVELSNTKEYAQFQNLEKVSLGDIVTIQHKPLDINMKARCISYKYDCLKQQYEEITIGHYQKNFFKETASSNSKLENSDFDISEEIQSVYAQAISKMSEMMNNSMNGYVVLSNSEILIMDTSDKTTAKNVWKFNSSGIAHSSTGYDGEYTVGMTMDGHINGALITGSSIKGDMIEAGTITTRELAVEIQNTIKTAMTEETTQALITANLNTFESNLSQTFVTQENASQQIQDATEVAIEQATQNIVNESVQRAMDSVNEQLDDKLSEYTTNTLNPVLQTSMNEVLKESKDYVVEITADYYTKDETDSIISQTRENIELGISSIYETKENTSIRIEEAIDGVNVGAINRVFGTAEEKTHEFTGVSNDTWVVYDISSDISDKDVIISFEYDLNASVENGSSLKFQAQYLSTSNTITHLPTYNIIESNAVETMDMINQQVSFTARFDALQQDAKFRFRADGITGTFTIRKAQIKVGNKITEWSIAPEDIEDNANNFTLQQLTNYYTKEQTDSQINIAKESISLEVSNNYYTKQEMNVSNGTNLIKNGGFEFGMNYWYTNNNPGITLDQPWQNYRGRSIFVVASGQKSGIFNVFKTEVGKTYSYSFYAQAENYTWYAGIEGVSTVIIAVSPNQWTKYEGTFVATSTTHTFICYSQTNGGNVFIDNVMVNEGIIPKEYSLNYEEVYESINNNTSLIQQTANSIRSEVSSTFNSYYNKNETDNKFYEVSSSVTQTINDLQIKFSQSGGYNLFRNSKFHGGYNGFWWTQSYNSPSGSQGLLNSTDQWGFPDKEVNTVYYTLAIGQSNKEWGLAQTVETTIGKQYTISFYYASHRCSSANIIVRKSDGSWLSNHSFNPSAYSGGNSSANNWGRATLTFTATQTSHQIEMVMNNCNDSSNIGYFWIAKPQCEEGSVASAWSPAPNEVMTGITTINENGITVSHSNANTTTNMSASGFKITKTSTGKSLFNATNGNLTIEGVLATGTSGKYIKVSDSNYKMYNGSLLTGVLGLYSNDIWTDSPKLYLGQEGVGESTGKTYFSISSYKANENPQSYTHGYTDIAQYVPAKKDYSNIKLYGDGEMRISPVVSLEITTNCNDGAYVDSTERSICKFASSSSSNYGSSLDISAITNHDRNGNGLILEHNRSGTWCAVRVNVDGSYNRYFRPMVDNNTQCGSSSFRWNAVYSANGTIQTSDARYKVITDDTDIQDCFEMVKNTNIYNYVMLDKSKEKMSEIELAESALYNVGQESSIQVGVMAQELLNYKCGKQIVVHENIIDEETGEVIDDIYNVNAYPFATAVAGALKYEIAKREELEQLVKELQQKIEELQ